MYFLGVVAFGFYVSKFPESIFPGIDSHFLAYKIIKIENKILTKNLFFRTC